MQCSLALFLKDVTMFLQQCGSSKEKTKFLTALRTSIESVVTL